MCERDARNRRDLRHHPCGRMPPQVVSLLWLPAFQAWQLETQYIRSPDAVRVRVFPIENNSRMAAPHPIVVDVHLAEHVIDLLGSVVEIGQSSPKLFQRNDAILYRSRPDFRNNRFGNYWTILPFYSRTDQRLSSNP